MSREVREEARRREEERRELARRRERFAGDVRRLAGQPEGRRFLRWLVEQGDVFADDYQAGPAGAYRAGRRSLVLGLLRRLREHLPFGDFVSVTLGDAGDKAPIPDEPPHDDASPADGDSREY